MPDGLSIQAAIHLPPAETIRAFDARGEPQLTRDWTDMWQADHARAFTVAKVAKLALLQDIQSSLAGVIHLGGTFEQWQAEIEPMLRKAGWWGEVTDRDLTGTDETVVVGPRRLRTIYDTNLRMSRAAGRWARIQALKGARPFLRYVAVLDSRTRPAHRAWNGTILPVDHAWWDTHFPPCGWYCRCTVRQLSQRELDAKGWTVTDEPPGGKPVPFHRPSTGETVMVPPGISPGFAYNPGKASMAAIADQLRQTLEAEARTNVGVARTTLDAFVRSDALLTTLADLAAKVPVMVLDQRAQARIGATNSVVVLSADSYQKQLGATSRSRGHPDIGLEQYRLLPEIGADPQYVFDTGKERHFAFFRPERNKYLVAVLKALGREGEIYVQSLRWAEESEVRGWLREQPDAGSW